MAIAIGSTVSFGDWDDSTGDEIVITGTVISEFTDPEDRNPRPSFNVRTAGQRTFTPYVDECRPATTEEVLGMEQCAGGMHSWVDKVGKLPALTQCTRCGDYYGNAA